MVSGSKKNTLIATFVFFTFIAVVQSLPNSAPYINAKDRPLDIAHRGLSSILPENTMEAF